jgi:IS5 family transposase
MLELKKRYEKLEEKKKILVMLNEMIPWDIFREILEVINIKPRKNNAGRKAMDVILMFKMLVLQNLYNLSDEELEYQINDRLSFMKFVGLGIGDKVPDATTLWLFREKIKEEGLERELFEKFNDYLNESGYKPKEGQILDATLIPVPKQRNNKEENKKLKEGKIPEEWEEEKNKNKLEQKDVEARWTKKNGIPHYGYKAHISVDREHKIIRKYEITDASVHDSQVIGNLLDGENEGDELWADSAYFAEKINMILALMGFDAKIHERAFKNKPLTEEQKENNTEKSKNRARVEHVFGCWVMSMGGKLLRCIGIDRAKTNLGLKNLVYNLRRFICLESMKKAEQV